MIHYSDGELTRWWQSLTKHDQRQTLARMVNITDSDFSKSIFEQYESGKVFSAKQLAAIRKWAS